MDETVLCEALARRDPQASAILVQEYGILIFRILKSRRPTVPEEVVQDASHDALLALIQHPDRFDPTRGGLPCTAAGASWDAKL